MFAKLAATITKNAPKYATKWACDMAARRIKAAWLRAGGYGNVQHICRDAIWACQLRWAELDGIERDAKYAAAA